MKITDKRPVLTEIGSLIPYELNAKKHDPKQVDRLATSIQKFGWRGNPIIIDKNGVIISGHGRRLAAMQLGLTKVPVVCEDDMNAQEARAFRLADNRSAVGDLDNDILQEELLDLGEDVGDLLDGIFDKKELDFAVADIMVMNEDVFVSDLDTVMDETDANTSEKIESSGTKRVALAKALGFKDLPGSDLFHVNRFMAQLEANTGLQGAEAFMDHIRGTLEKISHG